MAIEFDFANKYIKITSGTSITALEIYNAVMDWCDAQENMGYSVPMRAIGKANMGGGIYSDSIFILQNGWKIKLYDGTYQFTITGTLIALDENGDPYSRTEPPDYGNVEVIFQVSSQGTLIVSGSGVTEQDKQDIASLVETQTGQPIKTKVNSLPSDPACETTVTELQSQLTEVEAQTLNIELHHIGRVKMEGDYLLIYDTLDTLIAKYLLVKDGEGRTIERISQELP